MSKYDLTFLLNEEAELKVLKDVVASLDCKIIKEEKWGEKTLSYPIKGNTKANYYQWHLEMPKANVMEFRKKLQFNEKLIRYLLLAID
jgi:small subunit ribosomal protein S6